MQSEQRKQWAWLTIRRLLGEQKIAPGQRPAIQCGVMVSGMPHPMRGALSETEDGGLRMLSPAGAGLLVEQFFDYSDVIVVAVERAVTVGSLISS